MLLLSDANDTVDPRDEKEDDGDDANCCCLLCVTGLLKKCFPADGLKDDTRTHLVNATRQTTMRTIGLFTNPAIILID